MMMKRLLLAVMMVVSAGGAAHAQVRPAPLTLEQQTWLGRIEDNLANTKVVQARFHQENLSNGQESDGDVTLERPGRMRFHYDDPSPLLLVANHGKVVFQDKSIDQVTTIPLQRTPLGLLMQPHPHFSGDVTVTGFSQMANTLRINVVRTETPGEGELTLIFTTTPLTLQGWDLVDAQGHKTQIRLSDIHMGGTVSSDLFTLPQEEE